MFTERERFKKVSKIVLLVSKFTTFRQKLLLNVDLARYK
jgi:hypothetical protein